MKFRNEWAIDSDSISERFYSKEETTNEVIENFDIRRLHSAEGEQLNINGQTDWCLVQTSSNPLRELNDLRKIHCPMSMQVNRGDYVFYENDTWLIDTNVVNVAGAYQTARMNRCSYVLKWQNSNGNIIERPIVSYNASSYNNGVEEGKTIELGSDQLMLLLPFDEDTKSVKRGKKFFIDNNLEDPMTYELTRPDRTTYVFNGVGYIQWLVTECQHTPTSEELETGICEYKPSTSISIETYNETTVLRGVISGKNNLRVGLPCSYTINFFNDTSVNVDWNNINFIWEIDSDINLTQVADENKIELFTDDSTLVGTSFYLRCKVNNDVVAETEITITELF